MNIDLDNLEDWLLEDGDLVHDSFYSLKFKTFFEFLPELRNFAIELDKVYLTIQVFLNSNNDFKIDRLDLDFSKIGDFKNDILHKLKSDIDLKNLGYKDILFDGIVEYDSQFFIEMKRIELDGDCSGMSYSLDDILLFLEDRDGYINKTFDFLIFSQVSWKLRMVLGELKSIKESYLRGNLYNLNFLVAEHYTKRLDNHIEIFKYYMENNINFK